MSAHATGSGTPGDALAAVCALTRASTNAAAVSLALVEDAALHYVAADGAGADVIVGTRLAAGRGIAGFVAATGQSLTVRDPAADPRHARDVSAATGYTPAVIQCLPVDGRDGEVAAVLSILDGTAPSVPLGAVVALVADLIGRASDEPDTIGLRLARMAPDARAKATVAISAILDALER